MAGKRSTSEPASGDRLRQWHRLFGLLLMDHLADSPFSVTLEMDLSLQQQFLDVVVVRRRAGQLVRPLPDGFDDLADHNLISFKSYREPLNDWALKELTGHYVNYRKQVSPDDRLLPEEQFRMIAVSARRPRDLLATVAAESLRPGVYICRRGTDDIRMVVASELAREERNSLLHLFSATPAQVQYGAEHYRFQKPNTSSIVNELFAEYRSEGLSMPYTMEDFKRDVARKYLQELTPEERFAGLTPEELLGLLSREQIESYLKQTANTPVTPTKKKARRR